MDYKYKYLKYKMKYYQSKKDNNYPLTLSTSKSNDDKVIQIGEVRKIGDGRFGLVFSAELIDDSLKKNHVKILHLKH